MPSLTSSTLGGPGVVMSCAVLVIHPSLGPDGWRAAVLLLSFGCGAYSGSLGDDPTGETRRRGWQRTTLAPPTNPPGSGASRVARRPHDGSCSAPSCAGSGRPWTSPA